MRNKIGILLTSLLLLGYIVSINSASFYMLKGFTNAQYYNISANSFILQYPINNIATTPINVSATFINRNILDINAVYNNTPNDVMLSGVNGSVFEGNLSYIPFVSGILVPKYTMQGNTYKTLAVYYNPNGVKGYSGLPYKGKQYVDTLQNNYVFEYSSFLNYNFADIQAQTIPTQPNNNTNTQGSFKVSFDNLPIPYYLTTASAFNIPPLNLTYYRGTGAVARQIQAVYSNSNAILIGNNNAYMQQATTDNGLLLNPFGKIWFGYLNIPLYYYNYNITNGATTNSVPIGLYYTNYNYILNIQMPNTQKVYSIPQNFYFLIPAYANATISTTTNTTTTATNMPLFQYQFNITNINWTMQPSAWLNWSGGYTIKKFYNPNIKTKYLMFSLPAYPCLQTTDGNYGAIQVFAYQGSTNLGRVPIAEWQKQGNSVYYVMPNTTTLGLTYSNAVAYICTPQPIQSQLNSSLATQFLIGTYGGSGNAKGIKYSLGNTNLIAFINHNLFYGNETFSVNTYSGSAVFNNVSIYAQKINNWYQIGAYAGGNTSLNQLANNKIYVVATFGNVGGSGNNPLFWSNNEAYITTTNTYYSCGNYGCTAEWEYDLLYNATTNTTTIGVLDGSYTTSTSFNLPYSATATLVNYFTTKYTIGNLSAIATTSSSNSSGVSNPIITPSSPKLNLTITNSTIAANIATLNSQFNKSVALFGVNVPLGAVYIIVLIMIIVLALVAKTEGAVPLVLAVMWFAGLIFLQELIIAAIITLVYATYKAEGLFK